MTRNRASLLHQGERRPPVKAVPVGARFFHHRKLWQVTKQGSHTEAVSVSGRDEIRRYYDRVTADKAGQFCWDEAVELS